jgi:hypothetical protein
MPAFMDGKVDVVEQRQLAPMEREEDEKQDVEDQPRH